MKERTAVLLAHPYVVTCYSCDGSEWFDRLEDAQASQRAHARTHRAEGHQVRQFRGRAAAAEARDWGPTS
jgi:hypothetical protein